MASGDASTDPEATSALTPLIESLHAATLARSQHELRRIDEVKCKVIFTWCFQGRYCETSEQENRYVQSKLGTGDPALAELECQTQETTAVTSCTLHVCCSRSGKVQFVQHSHFRELAVKVHNNAKPKHWYLNKKGITGLCIQQAHQLHRLQWEQQMNHFATCVPVEHSNAILQ